MSSFEFHCPKTILVEAGSSARMGELADGLGARSALLVTDRGVELAAIVAPQAGGSEQARAAALVERLSALPAELGLKTRLSDVGITRADLPRLAEDAMRQTRLLVNNPREIRYEDALAIYAEVL